MIASESLICVSTSSSSKSAPTSAADARSGGLPASSFHGTSCASASLSVAGPYAWRSVRRAQPVAFRKWPALVCRFFPFGV